MKELYISPELEILCFAPAQALASIGIGNVGFKTGTGSNYGNGLDSDPDATGQYEETVAPDSGEAPMGG